MALPSLPPTEISWTPGPKPWVSIDKVTRSDEDRACDRYRHVDRANPLTDSPQRSYPVEHDTTAISGPRPLLTR